MINQSWEKTNSNEKKISTDQTPLLGKGRESFMHTSHCGFLGYDQ